MASARDETWSSCAVNLNVCKKSTANLIKKQASCSPEKKHNYLQKKGLQGPVCPVLFAAALDARSTRIRNENNGRSDALGLLKESGTKQILCDDCKLGLISTKDKSDKQPHLLDQITVRSSFELRYSNLSPIHKGSRGLHLCHKKDRQFSASDNVRR